MCRTRRKRNGIATFQGTATPNLVMDKTLVRGVRNAQGPRVPIYIYYGTRSEPRARRSELINSRPAAHAEPSGYWLRCVLIFPYYRLYGRVAWFSTTRATQRNNTTARNTLSEKVRDRPCKTFSRRSFLLIYKCLTVQLRIIKTQICVYFEWKRYWFYSCSYFKYGSSKHFFLHFNVEYVQYHFNRSRFGDKRRVCVNTVLTVSVFSSSNWYS